MNKRISNNKAKVLQMTLLATAVLSTSVLSVSADESHLTEPQNTTIDEVSLSIQAPSQDDDHLPLNQENSDEKSSQEESERRPLINQVDPSNLKDLWQESGKGKGGLMAVIDSGIELEHGMLQTENAENLAYPDEKTIESRKKEVNVKSGKWVNEKVPFFHDYSQEVTSDNAQKENKYHGTHVAGIAVGDNLKQKENDLQMQGTAPEAQLLFLKVDAKDSLAQREKLYAKAIQDAIALGASTINLSLGNMGRSSFDMQEELKKALELANEKGVAVVVAAGNDFAMGGKDIKPFAKNPDSGVIGTPATNDNVLTIAAYVPQESLNHVMTVQTSTESKAIPISVASPFPSNEALHLVFLENSLQVAEKDRFKDKVIVISYDHVSSSNDLASQAQQLGARGVFVHHKAYNKPLIPLSYSGPMPMGFISREDAESLKALDGAMVSFSKDKQVTFVPGGRQMADFSSWGLSTDGRMKPDLAAPGYEVYSPTTGNNYDKMSGTSAASPHAAGIILLLQGHIKKKYPKLSPKEQLLLVKNILMSTASPMINPDTKSYYSPRQQGAGAINAKKALESELYLTGPSGLAKIHLGDVANQFTIKAYLHNLSDKEKTLTYYASILTDKTENGRFTLESQELYQTAKTTVTIGPKEKLEIMLNIDVSAYDQKLKELMEKGYFLDGFVHVQSQDGVAERISIPFLGFKGRFADLEALDTPIYNSLSGTFYYSPKEGQDPLDFELDSVQQIKEKYLTGLMTTFTPWSLVEGSKLDGFSAEMASEVDSTDYLGSYVKEGDNSLRRFRLVNGKPILTISPNGDNNMDKVAFRGVFLRNVKDIKAQVFAGDNLDYPIWESSVTDYARKDVNTSDIKESFMEKTTWDGKDSSGNTVPEGTYIYRISYTPIAEGAKQQSHDFSILVDLTAAKLPEKAILNIAERRIELVETGDKATQEIYRDRLYLKYGSEEPNFISFEKDEDGFYILPEEVEDELSGEMIPINLENEDHFYFVREDWAGNFSVITLSQLLKQKPEENNELSVKPDKENQSILEEKTQSESQQKQAQMPQINSSFEDKISPKDANKEALPKQEVKVRKDKLIEKEKRQELNPAKPIISEENSSLTEMKKDYLPITAERQNPLTIVGIAMFVGGLFQAIWSLIKKNN